MRNRRWMKVSLGIVGIALLGSYVIPKHSVKAEETIKAGIHEVTYNVNTLRDDAEKVYGIGSVSKMFTTVAVLKLVDEGKIDLNTPVCVYIPEFTMEDARYQQITPLMLLNHSSGINGTIFHNAFDYGTDDLSYHDTFLETLSHQTLKADPGEFSVYCNDGFTLAELLVERVSGMDFSEYVRKEISEPLGLENTFTPVEEFDPNQLATVTMDGHTMPYMNCHCIGSGGIYSTTEDVARFGQIFTEKGTQILSKESVELMQQCWYEKDAFGVCKGENQQAYGLGWDCVDMYPYSLYGIKALSKGGDIIGYHANLTVLPEQNISVAVNSAGEQGIIAGEMAQDIILQVLQEEGLIGDIQDISVKPKEAITKETLPKEYQAYAGCYLSNMMIQVSFDEDGTLLLQAIDDDYDIVGKFAYIGNGEFVSTNGVYLSTYGCAVNSSGTYGKSILSFCKESNGKTYLKAKMYETKRGIGEALIYMLVGEKVENQSISDEVNQQWQLRDGKKYYLVKEGYNSSHFITSPYTKAEQIETMNGYVKSTAFSKPCRIVDASTAVCEMSIPGMVGRDLSSYSFYQDNNTEYLKINEMTFMSEDGMISSNQLGSKVVLPEDETVVWYRIEEKDASKIITITVPEHAAYYLYDKDDNCIASSLYVDEVNSIVLPEDGCLVFAGDEGGVFEIE